MTVEVGTDAIALLSPALMASKSATVVTPLASMLPMALKCAMAACFSDAPSMAAPITSALSMALRTACGEAPEPGGFRAKSELQSTSFRKGYAAVESFLAAASIAAPDTLDVSGAGVIGCALTTSLNCISAA